MRRREDLWQLIVTATLEHLAVGAYVIIVVLLGSVTASLVNLLMTHLRESSVLRPSGIWVGQRKARALARKIPDPRRQLLVRGMGVDDRRQRTRVSREPLREEQVLARPVEVGDGR